jgi:hypothetical protein
MLNLLHFPCVYKLNVRFFEKAIKAIPVKF